MVQLFDFPQTMPNLSHIMLEHREPMTLSGGLKHAIRFAELLDSVLDARASRITVSGVRDGLFFYDPVRGRGAFVTINAIASCGRLYLGESPDFESESKAPKAWLRAQDWQDGELETVVHEAAAFLVAETFLPGKL